MRITSWNVNGLKSMRPLAPLFKSLDSDIICLQETKMSGPGDPELESVAFVEGYDSFFSICKQKRGYSGVATFCRKKVATPYDAGEGFCNAVGGSEINGTEYENIKYSKENRNAEDEHDPTKFFDSETLAIVKDEGRCVITDHGCFVLINVYVPAVTVTGRATFKIQFLHALEAKVNALRRIGRRVIVAGDFNICPSLRDRAEPVLPTALKEWNQSPSRLWFRALLERNNMVDSFRELHPHADSVYTCWSEATKSRENNHGSRIDLIVASRDFFETSIAEAAVWSHIKGSDHCPVTIRLRQTNETRICAKRLPSFCIRNMPRFEFRQQSLTSMLPKLEPSRPSCITKHARLRSNINKGFGGQANRNTRRITQSPKKGNEFPAYRKRKERYAQTSLLAFMQAKEHTRPSHGEETTNSVQLSNARESVCEKDGDICLHNGVNSNPSKKASKNQHERELLNQRKVASQAWRKLLSGPPPTPRCRHGELCVLKKVSKSGENRGRTFFSCRYPAGIGNAANCNFFQWAPFRAGFEPT